MRFPKLAAIYKSWPTLRIMRPNTPAPLVAADEVGMVVSNPKVVNGCDLQRGLDRVDAEQLSIVRDELIAHL